MELLTGGFLRRTVFGVIIFLAAGGACFGETWERSRGIYALAPIGKPLSNLGNILDNPGISGISYSFEWKELEKEKGKYDWTRPDEIIRAVKKKNKSVTLRVLPGISSPNRVYEQGAEPFVFTDRNPYHGKRYYARGHRYGTRGDTLKIPVPWDNVFLSAWEDFIAAFGNRYAKAGNIAMIHVTGPTAHSAEMHLPKSGKDRQKWKSIGYTPEKLIGSWSRCIDAFAKSFPETPVVLNLSPAVFDDGVPEAAVRYGHEAYGKRLFLQNNILRADNKSMKRKDWGILKAYAGKTTVGFQRGLLRLKGDKRLSKSDRLGIRRANLRGMLEKGMALGGKYFEIGFMDARDFPEVVEYFGKLLKPVKTIKGGAK